jgi:hypothetical protein
MVSFWLERLETGERVVRGVTLRVPTYKEAGLTCELQTPPYLVDFLASFSWELVETQASAKD